MQMNDKEYIMKDIKIVLKYKQADNLPNILTQIQKPELN